MPVALVTGSSRGLGRQIARVLSEKGYDVVVNYRHSEKEASHLLELIAGTSIAVKADIGKTEQIREMAEVIGKEMGRLDVIINNAGISRDNLLLKQTEAEWDDIIAVNLKGAFQIIKIMAPLMIQSGGGHIVNISSYAGVKGKAGQSAYSASKAALLGLTRSAAFEMAEYDIKVNAILPGYLETEMGNKAQKARDTAREESLLKRLSSPETVADFIVYLVSTQNITGQVFSLDSRIL